MLIFWGNVIYIYIVLQEQKIRNLSNIIFCYIELLLQTTITV